MEERTNLAASIRALTIPVLEGKSNWSVWSKKFKLILKSIGAKRLIGPNRDAQPSANDLGDLDDRIHAKLLFSITKDYLLHQVENTETTHEAYYKLEEIAGAIGARESMRLIADVFTPKQLGRSIAEYIADVENRITRIAEIPTRPISVPDHLKAMIIMNGLDDCFESTIDSLVSNFRDVDLQSASITASLIAKEDRMGTTAGGMSEVIALRAKVTELEGTLRKSHDRKWVCFHCMKSPCFKKTCWHLHPELAPASFIPKQMHTSSKQTEVKAYTASTRRSVPSCRSCWLIDSGCNNHITHNSAAMADMEASQVSVILGDDHEIKATDLERRPLC